MMDKIKEFSNFLLVCGVVLYSFGFITVSSFLARFDLVTFDIINARFLIAGVISSISVVICLFLTWHLCKKVPINNFFDIEKWRERLLQFILMCVYIQTASVLLTSLFNFAKYKPAPTTNIFEFHRFLGKYDTFGLFLEERTFSNIPGYDFLLKLTSYIFFHSFIALLIIVLIVIFIQWIPKKEKTPKVDDGPIEIVDNKNKVNGYVYFLKTLIELFILCFAAGLLIWSYYKLRMSFIDFSTIKNGGELTYILVFAWMYSLVISLYLFIGLLFKNEINKSLFTINDIYNYENLIRYIVLPIITAIAIFGWTIFPRIPVSIGGGQPREIKLKLSNNIDIVNDNSKVYLLGESNQFFFIVINTNAKSKALQISKEQVEYIETKNIDLLEIN